jgi:hypothetical protein
MIPKEAIEKAVEGGWLKEVQLVQWGEFQEFPSGRLRLNFYDPQTSQKDYFDYEPEKIALDPSFWQALGKALGWEKYACSDCREQKGFTFDSCVACDAERGRVEQETYLVYAHWFYDLILTGGDTEAFWKDILR